MLEEIFAAIKAADLFPEISDKMKYEDMLSAFANARKQNGGGSEKKGPQETPEQMAARLQADAEKKLNEERQKLYLGTAFDQIESSAVANKLDGSYRGLFRAAIEKELEPEFQGDKVIFKNRADGKHIIADGGFAGPEHIAGLLLKKYPRLLAGEKQSPTPPAAGTSDYLKGADGKPLNRLAAGVSELPSMAGAAQ